MKLIVMSDSHGDYKTVLQIVEKYKDDDVMFLHLGDGDAEFNYIMDKKYPELAHKIVCGNCDCSYTLKDEEIFTVEGKKIFMTHGHRYDVKTDLNCLFFAGREENADIVLYGHTHCPKIDYQDGMYIINPGSIHMGYFGSGTYATIEVRKDGILPNIVKL